MLNNFQPLSAAFFPSGTTVAMKDNKRHLPPERQGNWHKVEAPGRNDKPKMRTLVLTVTIDLLGMEQP